MLSLKSSFGVVQSSSGGTGQNTLFYDPETQIVQYMSSPFPQNSSTVPVSNLDLYGTTTAYTSLTFVNTAYTTGTLIAGNYFVISCVNYTGTGGGIMRIQLRNNQSGATFGDYGDISVQVTGVQALASTSGITTLTSSGTIVLQVRRTTGTNVSTRGGSISVFRYG